ncbi:conserved hypothetical protein [Agrobacterium tumefaciens str. CFBP 5621]|uniref:hypothetical protein n=1 Tax=Agrobacterium tumefaciens TaxID=358 RepID=UPI0009BA1391|nr:hypothetical protein [Agrobacterium tumefaciens]CUX50620.1 conserved hypothetical protein [Agrobacterium tumefaciens str. CFBP 5621]
MFEIVGDDIALLNDTDLRALIGLLCEAEMHRQALPVTAVTWGGSQNAGDGGLDVRVELPAGGTISGVIPSPSTGFQVKKPDMPAAAIAKEMRSNGVLRPVFLELAGKSGAYIIVSSTGSTSDSALKSRRNAMAKAVEGSEAEGKLTFDFFDRGRVATWVRDHAALIPWVRSRIGKAVPGWRSFGPWSRVPAGVDPGYLVDGHTRMRTDAAERGDEISVVDGINLMRDKLRQPGGVVRLVGLSGVGKTRLAEALFDETIGGNVLDRSQAIYTDISDDPQPPPKALASDLNAARSRAIVVVDNCSSELHRHLSEVARESGSHISILTIEYDIRDDQPEDTNVFHLEASSTELIARLLQQRFPDLSQVDAETIAEFSGGNARIAIVLASQLGKTETVVGLNQEELFNRLFHQRHQPDPALLAAAQACSLVYSFDGEHVEGADAELSRLGALIGKSAEDIYAAVVELKERDLVQARAQWRAVLPHAIANRLAKSALACLPPSKIRQYLVDEASERMLRSFSRRLGYLNDSKEARTIVEDWLRPGSRLGDITGLTDFDRELLFNVAPLAPGQVLEKLEESFGAESEGTLVENLYYLRLLRSLAYDEEYFERAIAVLSRFAIIPPEVSKDAAAGDMVESLFFIALSGTHATIETRGKVAESFLSSDIEQLRALGLRALAALLKSSQFTSAYEFDFGARSRDYGYYPESGDEVQKWFSHALNIARRFALPGSPVANEVKTILSTELRDLWRISAIVDLLDQVVRELANGEFWREAWIALRKIQTYEGAAMSVDLRRKLDDLEHFLRPRNLVDQVHGVVIDVKGAGFDLDEFDEDEEDVGAEETGAAANSTSLTKPERVAATIERLGGDVGRNVESFRVLLPALIAAPGRVSAFAAAMAQTADRPHDIWDEMRMAFAAAASPRMALMTGFIHGLHRRDADLAESFLDEAVLDDVLGPHLPHLQAAVGLDHRGIDRLHRALDLGIAPSDAYLSLIVGRITENVPGAQLRDLVLRISGLQGGLSVAIDILAMRLHGLRADKDPIPNEIREAGRSLIDAFEFPTRGGRYNRDDYDLAKIIRYSLTGKKARSAARRLIRKLMRALTKYTITAHDFGEVVRSLLQVQPILSLDELFPKRAKSHAKSLRMLESIGRFGKRPLDAVSEETLFEWLAVDPANRFPLAAATVKLYEKGGTETADEQPTKWSPLAVRILREAPDQKVVLDEFVSRLYPKSWSGSYASALERGLKFLRDLPVGDQDRLQIARTGAIERFENQIQKQRNDEARESREQDNRFE